MAEERPEAKRGEHLSSNSHLILTQRVCTEKERRAGNRERWSKSCFLLTLFAALCQCEYGVGLRRRGDEMTGRESDWWVVLVGGRGQTERAPNGKAAARKGRHPAPLCTIQQRTIQQLRVSSNASSSTYLSNVRGFIYLPGPARSSHEGFHLCSTGHSHLLW